MTWNCKYCKRNFSSERIFMKHECTPMLRSKEIQTVIGQSAYVYYKLWMEKNRRAAPSIETFMTSTYYGSFIKFSNWTREVGLNDIAKYVELMTNSQIAPSLWRRSEAYQLYLEHFDKKVDPLGQAEITLKTLIDLSEHMEISIPEVFDQLKVGEIIELIQQRRLSPWLLLCSQKFKNWYQALHEADRLVLMKSIGIEYWSQKFESNPKAVKELKEWAVTIGI